MNALAGKHAAVHNDVKEHDSNYFRIFLSLLPAIMGFCYPLSQHNRADPYQSGQHATPRAFRMIDVLIIMQVYWGCRSEASCDSPA